MGQLEPWKSFGVPKGRFLKISAQSDPLFGTSSSKRRKLIDFDAILASIVSQFPICRTTVLSYLGGPIPLRLDLNEFEFTRNRV